MNGCRKVVNMFEFSGVWLEQHKRMHNERMVSKKHLKIVVCFLTNYLVLLEPLPILLMFMEWLISSSLVQITKWGQQLLENLPNNDWWNHNNQQTHCWKNDNYLSKSYFESFLSLLVWKNSVALVGLDANLIFNLLFLKVRVFSMLENSCSNFKG